MRRTATLILFVLVAVTLVFAQNPPGTSNSPITTPQAQNPAVPNPNAVPNPDNSAAPPARTSPADIPQGNNGQATNPAQNREYSRYRRSRCGHGDPCSAGYASFQQDF